MKKPLLYFAFIHYQSHNFEFEKTLLYFAFIHYQSHVFEEDMTGNDITDQNNDNIIDTKTYLRNMLTMTITMKLFIFPVYYDKKPNIWHF